MNQQSSLSATQEQQLGVQDEQATGLNRIIDPLTSDSDVFDDIRPCRDDEVHSELKKICNDASLIDGIIKLRYPKLRCYVEPLLRFFVRRSIQKNTETIHNIKDFQQQVAKVVTSMISNTTDGLVFKGFEDLDPSEGYLFISNHRDISLDPALIDYALHQYGFDTVRIAIGDNLLRMPAATSLMRLNKSFIVKRSVTSMREKLKEIQHLSHYIGLSLKEKNSIWIAQREGRAKDGFDCTEEAVLKMLHMYGRSHKQDFAEYMSSLNIVPVSITYEFDPSDLDKARELAIRAKNNGRYQKRELEDIQSIINGIKGYKGRVSVVASKPIKGGFSTPSELATIIDKFIYTHYEMYPSIRLAANAIGILEHHEITDISEHDRQVFSERIASYPRELQNRVLRMYAAPYCNYLRAVNNDDFEAITCLGGCHSDSEAEFVSESAQELAKIVSGQL